MKDYLSIEKGISEIINKLNKLKKTAKDVCINISINKKGRGKTKRKARSIKLASKGNQYSNVYKSPSNVSLNIQSNKMNKTNKANKMNKTIEKQTLESETVESQPIESIEPLESSSEMSMSESEIKE